MNKPEMTEAEICQNFITPAINKAGWDKQPQIRRGFSFTADQVLIRGKLSVRGKQKLADFLLFYESKLPKENINHDCFSETAVHQIRK